MTRLPSVRVRRSPRGGRRDGGRSVHRTASAPPAASRATAPRPRPGATRPPGPPGRTAPRTRSPWRSRGPALRGPRGEPGREGPVDGVGRRPVGAVGVDPLRGGRAPGVDVLPHRPQEAVAGELRQPFPGLGLGPVAGVGVRPQGAEEGGQPVEFGHGEGGYRPWQGAEPDGTRVESDGAQAEPDRAQVEPDRARVEPDGWARAGPMSSRRTRGQYFRKSERRHRAPAGARHDTARRPDAHPDQHRLRFARRRHGGPGRRAGLPELGVDVQGRGFPAGGVRAQEPGAGRGRRPAAGPGELRGVQPGVARHGGVHGVQGDAEVRRLHQADRGRPRVRLGRDHDPALARRGRRPEGDRGRPDHRPRQHRAEPEPRGQPA